MGIEIRSPEPDRNSVRLSEQRELGRVVDNSILAVDNRANEVEPNPRFYNELIENIRNRGNRVREISRELDTDDLQILLPVAREALERELGELRAENEHDAMIIHEHEQSMPRRPAEAPHSHASSSNSAIDMRRSELLGSDQDREE